MKGAIERVLLQCNTYLVAQYVEGEDGKSGRKQLMAQPLDDNLAKKLLAQANYMGSTGLRGL